MLSGQHLAERLKVQRLAVHEHAVEIKQHGGGPIPHNEAKLAAQRAGCKSRRYASAACGFADQRRRHGDDDVSVRLAPREMADKNVWPSKRCPHLPFPSSSSSTTCSAK